MADKRDKENLEKLKIEYEKVRAKYGLPDFDEIDSEFEIRKADAEMFIIKEIRRAVIHKLTGIADFLEPVLNPSGHDMHSCVESKIFDKDEVDEMYKYYKQLWCHVHKAIHASLVSEKEEAEVIKEILKAWPEFRKKAQHYTKKIAEGWAKEEIESSAEHYMS